MAALWAPCGRGASGTKKAAEHLPTAPPSSAMTVEGRLAEVEEALGLSEQRIYIERKPNCGRNHKHDTSTPRPGDLFITFTDFTDLEALKRIEEAGRRMREENERVDAAHRNANRLPVMRPRASPRRRRLWTTR